MNKKVIAGIGAVGGALALAVGGQAFASHTAAKEVDSAIASVSEFVEVDYQKVNASLLGRGTQVKDVSITPLGSAVPIKVDEVVIYKYDKTGEVPTHVSMAINGMVLPASNTGENAESLKSFGYEKDLSVNFATEYQYQEKEQAIYLKKFKVGAEDMGDLDMTFHLSKVPLDENAMANPMALLGGVFHEAKIAYKDDSLIKRMFDTAAAAQGVSVEAYKKEAIANLEASLAGEETGLSKELVKEITAFINSPDEFSLTMSPKEPVPFSSLMGAGGSDEMLELLNVRFKS